MNEQRILITEDEALGQNTTLSELIKAKEAEGYVVSHDYMHEAVGKVVVMKHRSFQEKVLTHRDYVEKSRRRV
jgi:hypothetical protein